MQQIDFQLIDSRHVLRRIRNCMLVSRDWLHDKLRNFYDVIPLRKKEFREISKLSFWRFYYCSILWHYIIIEVSKNYESNRWLINHDELRNDSMTLLRKNESFMGQVIVELLKIRARTRGFTIGACTICRLNSERCQNFYFQA